MASKDLITIVSRAITDDKFRKLLLSNATEALVGYKITDEEEKMLRTLPEEAFDELTMDLEDRQSKSGFMGAISLMGSKDAAEDAGTIFDILANKYGSGGRFS